MGTGSVLESKPSVENREAVDDASSNHNIERQQVLSVGLNDALTKERMSPWSWAMVRLYGLVALTTLSKGLSIYLSATILSFNC